MAPTFDNGAHHPTVLVVLQALTAIVGEVSSCSDPPCIWKLYTLTHLRDIV